MSLKGHLGPFYGEYIEKEEEERMRIAFFGFLLTRDGEGYIECAEYEDRLNDIVQTYKEPMKRAIEIASLRGDKSKPNEEELRGMLIADSLLIRLEYLRWGGKSPYRKERDELERVKKVVERLLEDASSREIASYFQALSESGQLEFARTNPELFSMLEEGIKSGETGLRR